MAIKLKKKAEIAPRFKGKTFNQIQYVQQIRDKELVFGIGPAGTGKTFLAVACALEALRAKQVGRLVLTRPAVDAGERLGFLPGTIKEKVDPYLRPLYDAIDIIDGEGASEKMIEKGKLEIAPLAFMRGRTLSDAFVILDEAQNTTPEQIKMLLTRLGEGSKCVVTGDPDQTDLVGDVTDGLSDASKILRGIDSIGVVRFTALDIVRSALVSRIVSAYDAARHAPRKAPRVKSSAT